MDENKVEIPVEEYHDLLRKAERIAIVERLVNRCEYINTSDILAVLDIERRSEDVQNG